ncbi:glycosyltransferase family 4 protein [Pseudoalteromonas sp.]|uniref:glycosyltransferase family 4 protein n=1 Tax=Pseudoalteromonas sp. TaxID=53249 RepID=UPI0026063C56|nr:glycosyltransferase family 4 protein [Pseudoalteromonas sp.]MCP4588755.1 glycosyltransferase family 4 protein [Pseudoalteromonas sp.]
MPKKGKTIWFINQYASTPETGMGGRHYYLARELAKQDYNVYLIAASNNHLLRSPPQVTTKFAFEKQDGFTFVWVKVPEYPDAQSLGRIFNWFLFSWKLLALKKMIRDKPDVLVCSSPSLASFLGAKKIARDLHAKLVFEVRDIWPLTFVEVGGHSPHHPFIRFLQWIEDRAYQKSDLVISNLKYAVSHMMARGLEPEKFTWIPNGFCKDEIEGNQKLSQEVLNLLPKNKFVVGYAGTIGVANALESLIDAAEQLRDVSDIAFVLVGHGKQQKKLQEMVESKGLLNVTFINSIPKAQIQSMLDQFDLCYIGLISQPIFKFGVSPNKLFDYFYSAKPILYAIDSGEYHPVAEAQAGVEVSPQNVGEIVDGIVAIRSMSPEDRASKGYNGRAYALDNHEYSKLALRFAKALFNK